MAHRNVVVIVALGAVCVMAACGSSSNNQPAGSGGSGADAGVSGGGAGAGATAGNAGAAAGGGAAGSAGAAGTAGCLGDASGSRADVPGCDSLPYAGTTCAPNDSRPYGEILCGYMSGRLRVGVMKALFDCLGQAGSSADPCSDAHTTAAVACKTSVFEQACPLTESSSTCATLAASCADVAPAACETQLNAFYPDEHAAIVQCFKDGTQLGINCGAVYTNCVLMGYY